MRKVIDDVAIYNFDLNPALAEEIFNSFLYKGNANQTNSRIRFVKTGAPTSRLIYQVEEAYNSIELAKENSYIKFSIEDEVTLVDSHLIKLIKACTISQINKSTNYSMAVSVFTTALILALRSQNLVLPILVPTQNLTQAAIIKELNDYAQEICEDNKIPYVHVIVRPKNKTNSTSSLKALAGRVE